MSKPSGVLRCAFAPWFAMRSVTSGVSMILPASADRTFRVFLFDNVHHSLYLSKYVFNGIRRRIKYVIKRVWVIRILFSWFAIVLPSYSRSIDLMKSSALR